MKIESIVLLIGAYYFAILTILVIGSIYLKWKHWKEEKIFFQKAVDLLDSKFRNINYSELFSKAVWEFYIDILIYPFYYDNTEYTFGRLGSDIQVWIANGMDSVRFYASRYNTNNESIVADLNSKLTIYDKKLLWNLFLSNKKNKQNVFKLSGLKQKDYQGFACPLSQK